MQPRQRCRRAATGEWPSRATAGRCRDRRSGRASGATKASRGVSRNAANRSRSLTSQMRSWPLTIFSRCAAAIPCRQSRQQPFAIAPPRLRMATPPADAAEVNFEWRPRPESNRGARICSPLRSHSATRPCRGRSPRRSGAGYSKFRRAPARREFRGRRGFNASAQGECRESGSSREIDGERRHSRLVTQGCGSKPLDDRDRGEARKSDASRRWSARRSFFTRIGWTKTIGANIAADAEERSAPR